MKVQHQQVKLDRRQTLTEFIKEGQVKLKRGERYWLTDIAVTPPSVPIFLTRDPSVFRIKTLLSSPI
jgi:hypothetical protein